MVSILDIYADLFRITSFRRDERGRERADARRDEIGKERRGGGEAARSGRPVR